jgi:D-alanine--poly(phosphoribitol) ligase subunit 1
MMGSDYTYNLGQLFHTIASDRKEHSALLFVDGETCSYSELERLSNTIAAVLLTLGVGRNDVVAILNNKSRVSYSIMVACLKLGVIYTNLDPKSPIARFNKMMKLCDPRVLFFYGGCEELAEAAASACSTLKTIDYGSAEFAESIASRENTLPGARHEVPANTPAYLMFTSGSTGFPKGVVITHANLLNFIAWSRTTYGTTCDDVFTNINPMHFDNSVFDFYSSIFTGAALIPVGEELTRNPRKMLDALNPLHPTIWFSVPSMLVYVLNMRALRETDMPSLRIVTFGGEGFPKNQLRVLWSKWGHRIAFINVYGPTECTCICSSYRVTPDDLVNDDLLPLGPIAPNFYGLVMNGNAEAMPDGEIGELCIGGPNVGLGYYNNREKTMEAFVQNPFIATHAERIYKSGDLVRYDKKKNLFFFCGRKDNQIKRMGYRIELEEIEAALNSLAYITESAVIYLNTERVKEKIIACLCAEAFNEEQVSSDLNRMLPAYMMPNTYVRYAQLPKNQNGKIDRLKLKEECDK